MQVVEVMGKKTLETLTRVFSDQVVIAKLCRNDRLQRASTMATFRCRDDVVAAGRGRVSDTQHKR